MSVMLRAERNADAEVIPVPSPSTTVPDAASGKVMLWAPLEARKLTVSCPVLVVKISPPVLPEAYIDSDVVAESMALRVTFPLA